MVELYGRCLRGSSQGVGYILRFCCFSIYCSNGCWVPTACDASTKPAIQLCILYDSVYYIYSYVESNILDDENPPKPELNPPNPISPPPPPLPPLLRLDDLLETREEKEINECCWSDGMYKLTEIVSTKIKSCTHFIKHFKHVHVIRSKELPTYQKGEWHWIWILVGHAYSKMSEAAACLPKPPEMWIGYQYCVCVCVLCVHMIEMGGNSLYIHVDVCSVLMPSPRNEWLFNSRNSNLPWVHLFQIYHTGSSFELQTQYVMIMVVFTHDHSELRMLHQFLWILHQPPQDCPDSCQDAISVLVYSNYSALVSIKTMIFDAD